MRMADVESRLPKVSVVICTRNRPDTIRAAIESVLANDHGSFDLTVIDQSTDGATAAVLQSIVSLDRRLQYVHIDGPGLSRAYNVGIKQTAGDLLAFTDDDCIVPTTWLTAIARAFGNDADADLVYGQVLLPETAHQYKGVIPTLPIERPERLSQDDGFKVFGMGANFAARRRLFERIGGFDEMLGGGAPLRSSQDFDLAYRAYRAGSAILLRPEVLAYHYGLRKPTEWLETQKAYGIGDGGFYWKHVRCRDAHALRLFVIRVLMGVRHSVGRYRPVATPDALTPHTRNAVWSVAAKLWKEHIVLRLRGRRGDRVYVRSVFIGLRKSHQYGVNRQTRMYVPSR
jgi:glycosyltransferase involved in cell wall biosynthesis